MSFRTSGPSAGRYSVPPVSRAIAVLRYIAAGHRCRNLSRAAEEIGVNRTTLMRLLATLETERMIERIDEHGGYRLGAGLLVLAARSLNERGVHGVGRPILKRLVAELNLSAHLGVLDGSEIVYLARETPNAHLVSTVREGTRLPAHATTIGRILLAHADPAAVRELYADRELRAYTDRTATSLDALEAQLAADLGRGVTWSVGFFEPEIGSAAAAVFDHWGDAVAAINVTGPAGLFAEDGPNARRIEETVRRAAQEISAALGHGEPPSAAADDDDDDDH